MIAVLSLLVVAGMFVTAARVATIALGLPDEGVVVLGLHRSNGDFHGAPTGKTTIHAGDTVIAYGRLDHLQDLDDRHRGRLGDQAHLQAVEEQHQLVEEVVETND